MTPWAPLRACSWPGCPEKLPRDLKSSRCERHREPRWDDRPNAGARGYGQAWRKIRARILQRDPICVLCHDAPSTQCDHVQAKSAGGTDDPSNLRGVCRGCHDSRTGRQGQAHRFGAVELPGVPGARRAGRSSAAGHLNSNEEDAMTEPAPKKNPRPEWFDPDLDRAGDYEPGAERDPREEA
jgi:5-methylcytosine-specific restriction protein A